MVGMTLENVQAHVLRPAHGALTETSFGFVALKDPEDPSPVRSLLRRLLDQGDLISDADAHSRDHRAGACHRHVAVGFTAKGLRKLGHAYRPDRVQRPLHEDDPFKQGMRARADLLGDPPTDWPGQAWSGPDMLVWVATTGDAHEAGLDDLRAAWGDFEHHVERGSYPDRPVLGFLDGTSQPFVSELMPSLERLPGSGTVTRDGWRPVPLGEFVFGCADAGGERVLPAPAEITEGGTFVVYRKYAFDMTAFEAVLTNGVSRGLGSKGDVAAKIMGRYQDEDARKVWPQGDYDAVIPPDRANGREPSRNDFRYADDSYGYACPLGAHIRRANPRDALGFEGRLTERHRIIRRGVPWEEGGEKGLHFIAVNARIHDQFEFIQRQWLNTGSSFRLGDDIDLVAGSRSEGATDLPFVVQGPRPVVIRAPRPFARFVGGAYFLMPGIEGLRLLATEPE